MQQYPNWFGMYADQIFARHLTPLAGQASLRFLQIGAFTGDATLWLCDNVLTAHDSFLIDVDTWQGSDEPAHDELDFADVERVYDERTAQLRHEQRVCKMRMTSFEFLRFMRGRFDFIYIDGSHVAADVLTDAVLAVPLLKRGGLLAFDDYRWQSVYGPMQSPALAIDAMRIIFQQRIECIELDAQAWFRAIA